MVASISKAQKLFKIEGIEKGRVNIETTKYLLGLSEKEQIAVLKNCLDHLKRDFAGLQDPDSSNPNPQGEMQKAQLEFLIQVTQGLLSQLNA